MLIALLCLCALATFAGVKVQNLTSPNGKLTVAVTTDGQTLKWEVKSGHVQVLMPSAIQAVVDGKPVVSGQGSVAKRQQVQSSFAAPVFYRQQVDDNYGLLVMKCPRTERGACRRWRDGRVPLRRRLSGFHPIRQRPAAGRALQLFL